MSLMKSILPAAFAATLALGFCAGVWFNQGRHQRRLAKSRTNWQVSELYSYHTALGELREGRTSSAVELLEFSVDCLVCTLAKKAVVADDAGRILILETLRVIKAYRAKWPREVRADLLGGGTEFTTNVRSTAEEAQKALEEWPPSKSLR
jgi:hypothetical protein